MLKCQVVFSKPSSAGRVAAVVRSAPLGFAVVLINVLLIGCTARDGTAVKKSESPAKVEKLPQEIELARITLSESAEHRLGIELAKIVERSVHRRRTFGGELMIPAGKTTVVTAPVSGTIGLPTSRGQSVSPGEHIAAGTSLFSLIPLLSAERDVPTPSERMQMANTIATIVSAQTIAQGDVARGEAEVEAAQVALDRATRVFGDGAGSAKSVDDARALFNVATANLRTSRERVRQLAEMLTQLSETNDAQKATPLELTTPQSGVVRNILVDMGQTVVAGAPVFEIVDTATMWVRVPVYVGLLDTVLADTDAKLVPLGANKAQPDTSEVATHTESTGFAVVARPIKAPPSADPLSTTADLYYEVDNREGRLHPGERVGVELVLHGNQSSSIVPATSVLYDIYGGTWIYVRVGEHMYERRRVLVQFREDDDIVLAQSPNVGEEVVKQGAAELFGVEFGAGK